MSLIDIFAAWRRSLRLALIPSLMWVAAVCDNAVAEDYDYSLADSDNKMTALEYIYLANNQGRFAEARQKYYDPQALQVDNERRKQRLKALGLTPPVASAGKGKALPPPSPKFTVKRMVEEGDIVVVLAFVQGVGIGKQLTTFMGTPGGTKIGDAVVEIFKFNSAGKILQKWDVIEELSNATYDFR